MNGARRGEECEWAGDDFVTRLNTGGQQGEDQCVSSGRASDGVFRTTLRGDFLFKLQHFISKDEGLTFEAAVDSRSNFISNRCVLCNEIDEGHGCP